MHAWNLFVGHPQQQGISKAMFGTVETFLQDDGAGRESNFSSLDQVTLAVVQCLKWQVVKLTMWDDCEVAVTDLRFDRAQQSIVERAQVLLCASRESRQVISNTCRSIAQRVELKTTSLDLGYHLRLRSEISHDFYTPIGNYKSDQLAVDCRVFNQRAIGTECSLKPRDRKVVLFFAGLFIFHAAMLKLACNFQQLSFAFEKLLFQF